MGARLGARNGSLVSRRRGRRIGCFGTEFGTELFVRSFSLVYYSSTILISLGIGTLWESLSVTGPEENDCPYLGTNGNTQWEILSGCTGESAPTELDGSSGTRCGHWDETCLQDELMTGFVNGATHMPFSRLTLGTLRDLGYETVPFSEADNVELDPLCDCNTRRRQLRAGSLSMQPRKRPGNAARQNAIVHGQQVLAEARANRPSSVPAGLTYVGDQVVNVMFGEYDEEEGVWLLDGVEVVALSDEKDLFGN